MNILLKTTGEGSSFQWEQWLIFLCTRWFNSIMHTLLARLLLKIGVQVSVPNKQYTLSYKNPLCFWRPNSTLISTCKVAMLPKNLSWVSFQAHEMDKPNLGSASTYQCWRPHSLHALHLTLTPISAPHKFCIVAGTACQSNIDSVIWEILK